MESNRLFVLALIAFYVIGNFIVIDSVIRASRVDSLAQGFDDLFANGWGKSAYFDLILGFSFATLYILFRESNLAFRLVIIVMIWTFGSPVIIAYKIWRILSEQDWNVSSALCPYRIGEGLLEGHDRENEAVYFRMINYVMMMFSGFAFVAFAVVSIQAAKVESFFSGLRYAHAHPWVRTTFYDILLGLTFSATWISAREGKNWRRIVAWIIALTFLGNGATMLYCINLSWEALREDTSVFIALISRK